MKTRNLFLAMGLGLAMVLAGCGGGDGGNGAGGGGQSGSLDTPKESLRYQLSLLKAGDVEKLKACFTERQRNRITTESVAEGAKEMASYAFEDLYVAELLGEYKGQKTCKVKMKNGRTLTTFVLADGKWLADTVWFR